MLAAPHSSYMQQRLVGWVRDLDACLDGASSRLELLQLPLAAMQLLLAGDSLPVCSVVILVGRIRHHVECAV